MKNWELVIVGWIYAVIIVCAIVGVICLFIWGNSTLGGFLLAALMALIIVCITLILEK